MRGGRWRRCLRLDPALRTGPPGAGRDSRSWPSTSAIRAVPVAGSWAGGGLVAAVGRRACDPFRDRPRLGRERGPLASGGRRVLRRALEPHQPLAARRSPSGSSTSAGSCRSWPWRAPWCSGGPGGACSRRSSARRRSSRCCSRSARTSRSTSSCGTPSRRSASRASRPADADRRPRPRRAGGSGGGAAARRLGPARRPRDRAALLALVAADLLVFPLRSSDADEGNEAYSALAAEPAGRVLELPLFEPGIHFGSVYDYYQLQAPRERPGGYSTLVPRRAYDFYFLRNRLSCGVWLPGDDETLAEMGIRQVTFHAGMYEQGEVPGAWFGWRGLAEHGFAPVARDGQVTLLAREGRRGSRRAGARAATGPSRSSARAGTAGPWTSARARSGSTAPGRSG